MKPKFIQLELISDSTFGCGQGTAGIVDIEVEHDELGLPFLGGKTLRGLLRDSWLSMHHCFPELFSSAERIFGVEADFEEHSIMGIGDCVLCDSIRRCIEVAENRQNHSISPAWVLEALTDIRWQTSEERSTGAPAETTLRSARVVLHGLKLQAPIYWLSDPNDDDCRCLALALLATRHAGLGRNRGRGFIRLTIDGESEKTMLILKGGAA